MKGPFSRRSGLRLDPPWLPGLATQRLPPPRKPWTELSLLFKGLGEAPPSLSNWGGVWGVLCRLFSSLGTFLPPLVWVSTSIWQPENVAQEGITCLKTLSVGSLMVGLGGGAQGLLMPGSALGGEGCQVTGSSAENQARSWKWMLGRDWVSGG